MSDPIELVGQIKATMESMDKDNKVVLAKLEESSKLAGNEAKEAVKVASELAQKIEAQANSILDMEQKLSQRVMEGKAEARSLGSMVIASDAYKAFASGQMQKMTYSIQANTITGQSGSPPENSNILVQPDRLPGIVGGAFRALRVGDVIPQGQTTSNAVEYARELLFTNNAAERSEGIQKPESVLTFELITANVRTISHFIKVSKQVLEDAGQLQSYIDNRLRYGVHLRYETQIVAGDGANPNISGITASGNHTAFVPLTAYNQLDSINRAMENTRVAEYDPTAILLNPKDWGNIERLKHGSADVRYVVGNPVGGAIPMLWGLPVVVTNSVGEGKIIVGAFDVSHQIFTRSGVVVEMFEQDDDNVQKNLLTVRAEARGCLASLRPASCFYGDITI